MGDSRRYDDRDIKELFEAKLDVLDARYKNIGLQNDKLEAKVDKYLDGMESRLRQLETVLHGQGNHKGLMVRMDENESEIKGINTDLYMGPTGMPGLIDEVKDLKTTRKARDRHWAIMGGLASGFALWILGKFGNTAWDILSKNYVNTKTISAPAPRKRVVQYKYRVVKPKPVSEPPDTSQDETPHDE